MKCKSTRRYVSRLSSFVLGTNEVCLSARIRKEKEKRIWLGQPRLSSVWHTGLSGAPGQLRRTGHSREKLLRRTTIIHRTVRWCTGLSGEPTAGSATVGRAIRVRRVVLANGRLGAPDSVRCANQPEDPTVGCARNGRRSAPYMLQWLSGGAPKCPVRHPTEGKNCLPCWVPTAPSCLGAIKGTPRRMEESPKHSLIIPKHQDSTLAHSIL
jgi:hypothetical protein